jgi:intein/homing endonuclease
VVAFTAHPSEYWYYESFVKPTVESFFSVHCHLYLGEHNTTRLHICSKKMVVFLESLGLPVGKKIDASIPELILRQGLVVPFIRGLYHAEGSIYRRYSKKYNTHVTVYDNLLVIQIRMKLRTLMHQLAVELAKLEIRANRLTEKDGVCTLRVTSQEQIEKFLAIIQPKYKLAPHTIRL